MPERALPPMRTCRLGRVEYCDTARLQRSLRAAREAGAVEDVLLLLEHDDVITCGTRTEPDEVAYARTTGVPLVPVERGGKATWHGPGQVVAYPIFAIDLVDGDVRELVWRLEESIIATLRTHGVETMRRAGYPGVWVVEPDGREPTSKIASVGLRLTGGVTFHGIAVNVDCDLEPFTWFTPCGIADATMTSVAAQTGRNVDTRAFADQLAAEIAARFGLVEAPAASEQLRAIASEHPVDEPLVSLPGEPRPRPAVRIDLRAGASA